MKVQKINNNESFKNFKDFVSIVFKRKHFTEVSLQANIEPHTYRVLQTSDDDFIVTYGLTIEGTHKDEITVIIYGEPVQIDTNFSYKISAPKETYFGRTKDEFEVDFKEAFGNYVNDMVNAQIARAFNNI